MSRVGKAQQVVRRWPAVDPKKIEWFELQPLGGQSMEAAVSAQQDRCRPSASMTEARYDAFKNNYSDSCSDGIRYYGGYPGRPDRSQSAPPSEKDSDGARGRA